MHAPAQIPPEILLAAYRQGIFPMADGRDDPELFWVEPRERAIFDLADPAGFHVSRSLARTLRRDVFTVTCDTAFAQVVEECAAPRADHPESWISRRIAASYRTLHRLGHAHSVECWRDCELAGGMYGVAFDRVFCGESMFSRATDASKVALAHAVAALRHAGYLVFDCQFMTAHLASLGAGAMGRRAYLRRLEEARGAPRMRLPEAYASLSASASGAGSSSSPGKRIAQSLIHTS